MLQVIPEDINVRKAIVLNNPVVVSYPQSASAVSIMELAGKLSGVDYKPKVGFWHRLLDIIGLGSF